MWRDGGVFLQSFCFFNLVPTFLRWVVASIDVLQRPTECDVESNARQEQAEDRWTGTGENLCKNSGGEDS